jgi:hypothetical protein
MGGDIGIGPLISIRRSSGFEPLAGRMGSGYDREFSRGGTVPSGQNEADLSRARDLVKVHELAVSPRWRQAGVVTVCEARVSVFRPHGVYGTVC